MRYIGALLLSALAIAWAVTAWIAFVFHGQRYCEDVGSCTPAHPGWCAAEVAATVLGLIGTASIIVALIKERPSPRVRIAAVATTTAVALIVWIVLAAKTPNS